MSKEFKVRLMRTTRDYVEVLVNEDDVETAQHAIDFVNNQLEDPEWDLFEHAVEDSEYADVDQPFEVLDVEPMELPEAKTDIARSACEAAGIPVEELRLPSVNIDDMIGLPVSSATANRLPHVFKSGEVPPEDWDPKD